MFLTGRGFWLKVACRLKEAKNYRFPVTVR